MSERIDQQLKAVATVADVARMVGLSRARFYQLQRAGVFPWPVFNVTTRRPLYTEDQQRTCLEVRRRNCGVNGQPVLFYARRLTMPTTNRRPAKERSAPVPRPVDRGTHQAQGSGHPVHGPAAQRVVAGQDGGTRQRGHHSGQESHARP